MTEDLHRIIRSIGREIDKAKQIGEFLESIDESDPETFLLSLESETNLPESICRLYDAIMEYEIYSSGVAQKIDDLKERKQRIDKSAETLREVIFLAMEKAGLQKVSHPCATISIKNTARQLVISDEMIIPAVYWKKQDPILDRAKIKKDLQSGAEIAGCSLSNGGQSINIRVK